MIQHDMMMWDHGNADFRLAFNAAQTTLAALTKLAGIVDAKRAKR